MIDMELTGLQKYIKCDDDELLRDAAVYMIETAKDYSQNSMTDELWDALKNLVLDTIQIKRVMNVINQAYKTYAQLYKEGKITKQEQEEVSLQIKLCNKMMLDVYEELKQEGRIKAPAKQSKGVYRIKATQKEVDAINNELNLK